VEQVLARLGSDSVAGLSASALAERTKRYGPNAVSSHHARLLSVLWHQVRSQLLGLLLAAAIASYLVGEKSDAMIIGVIVAMSEGLGFVNEYRAEKAADALHAQISHRALVIRDGQPQSVDVTTLVPGTSSSCSWARWCRPTSGCSRSTSNGGGLVGTAVRRAARTAADTARATARPTTGPVRDPQVRVTVFAWAACNWSSMPPASGCA
jgi:hypothetical protein